MFFQRMLNRARIATALVFLLGLAACGGSGSSSGGGGSGGGGGGGGGGPSAGTDCTQPGKSDLDGCGYVTLSDVSGEFLTYTVKVQQLTLTRRDGTTTDVLPAPVTVDFARFTTLSEFLALNALPAGDYVSGVMTLDYSGADIVAQDASGNGTKLSPISTSGSALSKQEVTITLDDGHPLGLFAGTPGLLNLDFDLDASNIVNANHTVTVEPVVFASIDPVDASQQIRGSLDNVDTSGNKFTLALKPFNPTSGNFGNSMVYTTGTTSFIVDQTVTTGSAGLSALKAHGGTGMVLAQGSFDLTSHHFVAQQVFAGSTAPGGSADSVEGVVTARNGNVLTVRSAAVSRANQGAAFSDDVTVNVGTGTVVREADKPTRSLNSDAISVGQRLLVFGKLSGSSAVSLDATSGFALLEWTKVDGGFLAVGGSGPSTANITLNAQGIEGRPLALFDFTGTGSDPSNYVIRVPCTCLSDGVGVGDAVAINGFVTPFGSAQPDFAGQTLVDFENSDAVLSVAWSSGTRNAFTSLDAHGIVPNLSTSPTVHHVLQGDTITDLSAGTTATVKGASSGNYVLLQNGEVQVYSSFSSFVNAVQSALGGGSKVHAFSAIGGYNNSTQVLTATSASVAIQ